MAKNNNKGFSLLEIVVAITILTLLLTPILQQLAQTMATNRKTKEQQYANENAEYVLQYVQSNSQNDIASGTDAVSGIKVTNPSDTVENTHTCYMYCLDPATGNISQIYMTDGSGAQVPASVEYNTYSYRLNDVELGARNTVYSRLVVMDDLSVKVGAFTDKDGKAYRISYNNSTAYSGYELTSEGSLVQYSDISGVDLNGDGEDDKYVSAIVCTEYSGSASSDPNELNVGNMHDIDANHMALINGYATEYDEQARNDLYLELLELYKNSTNANDRARWEQEVKRQNYIANTNYTENIRKLTVLNIIKDMTNSCWAVSVDVVYEGDLKTQSGITKFIQKEYTVWAQNFDFADFGDVTCPEIYFEYQPFATSIDKTTKTVQYAAIDYILVNNEAKDAKIYLYKPLWDQAVSTYYSSSDKLIVESLKNTDNYYRENDYAFDPDRNNTLYQKKAYINIVSANDMTAGNSFTIYTNIDISGETATWSSDNQFAFNVNIFDAYFMIYSTDAFGNTTSTKRSVSGTSNLNLSYIKSIEDEESKGNRLYTVTVTLTPESENANTVVLTGAKGAN